MRQGEQSQCMSAFHRKRGENLALQTINTYFQSTSVLFPIGSIIAWAKSFTGVGSLPGVWAECNGQVLNLPTSPLHGQTLPNLNGIAGGAAESDGQKYKRFLRGSATSGTAGGAETVAFPTVDLNGGVNRANYVSDSNSQSILNPFYESVFCMRVL